MRSSSSRATGLRVLLLLVFVCFAPNGLVLAVNGQCIPTEVKIVASDGDAFEYFGESLAIYDKTMVVGCDEDNDVATDAGSVYVFSELSVGVWTEVDKIFASDYAADDEFGNSVAIYAQTIVVGAYADDDAGSNSGSAYVFSELSVGVWTEVDKLVASDAADSDYFGWVVAVYAETIVIGAHLNDDAGTNSGSAYVFSELSVGVWTEVQKLVASDAAATDTFGYKVAIYDQTIVVGAYGNDAYSGSVYVFSELSAGVWTEVDKLVASDAAAGDSFGFSVAIYDQKIVVGAISDENAGSNSGSAYVFSELSAGVWTEVDKLIASDAADNDNFGVSVGIYAQSIVVGAYGGLSVYIFSELSAGVWTEVDIFVSSAEWFGESVAIYDQIIVVSAKYDDETYTNTGSAYIYDIVDDCASNPCEHGGMCRDRFREFCCDCPISHNGTACDACACKHGGVCADDPDTGIGYCDCTGTGFIGLTCEIQCENNGASAIDETLNNYCDCTGAGFIGLTCETQCENNGASAIDETLNNYCDCTNLHWTGTRCQKSCNNGFSEAYPSTKCSCTGSGATGATCQTDIDDCFSSPCLNNGLCTDNGDILFPDHAHEFNCSCEGTGYSGEVCDISECDSSPCINNGVCDFTQDLMGNPNGVACNCSTTHGYEGEFCQTEIDECTSSPCENAGSCTDELDGYRCDCTATGYEGFTCSDDIDDCASGPCQNGGTCKDEVNQFQCKCTSFWTGSTCAEDVDDCVSRGYECQNGATCTDDPLNLGEIICTCVVEDGGFTGQYCDVPVESACVTFNPCLHGGKCLVDDVTNQMNCDCDNTGYEGDVCDILVYTSECISSPCLNGGQCYDPSDQQDDWFCDCSITAGYSGMICDITACDSIPCENGATCSNDNLGGYTCACPEDFDGINCESDQDDGAQLGSSSSSSNTDNGSNDETNNNSDSEKDDDGTVMIIVIVVVVVVLLIAGGACYVKSKQSGKTYAMPT